MFKAFGKVPIYDLQQSTKETAGTMLERRRAVVSRRHTQCRVYKVQQRRPIDCNQSTAQCINCHQGSTGVLKISGVPTWTVNFGVGFVHPKILLDAVLRGQPT